MKRIFRQELGVTLLEIMLVLAIAAMVIVMSIRYYQSAARANLANVALQEVQAITGAADSVILSTGTYANLSTAVLASSVGAENMVSPTGGAITVTAVTGTTYTVKMVLNASAICGVVKGKLNSNTKINNTAACSTAPDSGDLTYTYDNTK